jgi:hypothetical protein
MVGAVGQRDGQQRQADGGAADAGPLARTDVAAEPALGEQRQEDQAAGDDRLDDRQRRERQRGDVEKPGDERHAHADREPLRAEQRDGAGQRVAQGDVGGGHRPAMLEQEAEVRRQGAGERQQDSDL